MNFSHLIIEAVTFFLISGGLMWAYFYLEEKYKHMVIMKRCFPSGQKADAHAAEQINKNLKQVFISFGLLAMPKKEEETKDLKKLLGYAGYRSKNATVVYFGIKLALALLAGCLYLFFIFVSGRLSARTMVFFFFFAATGYYLPGMILKHQVRVRHRKIFHELPNTLDLLLICMEAGLSFDMALYRVSKELSSVAPVLSKEFGRYFLEIRGGLPRKQALNSLADRNGEKNLASVVQVMSQSADFGTDMVEAITVYSDSLRTERKQIAEEKGAKISTKLAFATIFLILPALLAVILGPAMINLIERVNFR
jgi:tight adherence protein C